MPIDPIKIEGLDEFRAAVRAAEADLPQAVQAGIKTTTQLIIDDARPRVPQRSGRARGSLREQSTQDKGSVTAGGSGARYFPWLDFGGNRRGRGGGVASRPYVGGGGRYIWKSFGDKRVQILEGMDAALVTVVRQAGLDVTTTGGA